MVYKALRLLAEFVGQDRDGSGRGMCLVCYLYNGCYTSFDYMVIYSKLSSNFCPDFSDTVLQCTTFLP